MLRNAGNALVACLSFLTASVVLSPVSAQAVPPAGNEIGVSTYPFDLSQVTLTSSRWKENQDRTLNYLKWVDVERLLYNFRANHGLSTNGAAANGGWDAPDFPFRTHFQGHFLTAWSYCYSVLKDTECRDRATYFVAELQKCQNNNDAAGFNAGYLSGFPESEFDALEARTLSNGNVPYYALHKTLAGLLDVWRHIGDETAKDVLLEMAGWVDWRTGRLSYNQMQLLMGTEFGGMNEVMADIWHQTGDTRWLTVAQRFDHAAVFDPLASNVDQLNGLHANTQVPKWIGAIKEFKGTGTTRYGDIARNAWDMTVHHHSYAIGGNSQNEHFRPSDAIAGYLEHDTCEACNTYNMLKLTRELWVMNPDTTEYFDFYERALLNHLLGQQNPSDSHGHITYFTSLDPGGHRGVGPVWGGGTWSTDYDSFWCCQGTALETNTKLMDSIYFHDGSSLFVNLFTPSVLDWHQQGVTITQSTEFPMSDTTTLKVTGTGSSFTMNIRIPSWVAADAEIAINGQAMSGVSTSGGSYAKVTRNWASGDEVSVRLPMDLRTIPANDDPSLAAIAYGPVILSGEYGSQTLSSTPTIQLGTITRSGSEFLKFTATAGSQTITMSPFYDAHDFNYNVYFSISGSLPSIPSGGDTAPPSSTATTTSGPSPTGGGTNCATMWGQCGGIGWTGPTCCVSGAACAYQNDWYYQCL